MATLVRNTDKEVTPPETKGVEGNISTSGEQNKVLQTKPDSPAILPDGTGTPYLAIFGTSGSPIMDTTKDLPIGMFVTSFEYQYLEEKSDKGQFVIVTDNVEIVVHPELDYKMGLQLQWGWILPNGDVISGPVRKVVIIEHKVQFSPEGVEFTVKFSDSTFVLNTIPATYENQEKGGEAWYKKLIENSPVGMILADYTLNHTEVETKIVKKL